MAALGVFRLNFQSKKRKKNGEMQCFVRSKREENGEFGVLFLFVVVIPLQTIYMIKIIVFNATSFCMIFQALVKKVTFQTEKNCCLLLNPFAVESLKK